MTITPVPVTVTLTQSRRNVVAGDTVTFSLSMSPTMIAARPIPFKVTSSVWAPDAGGTPTSSCPTATGSTCKRVIAASGTLTVKAYANGSPVTLTARVAVVPCPTGDSAGFLDDPRVRAGFQRLWQSSNFSDPTHSNRREHGGFVYYDNAGDSLYVVAWPDPKDTPCANFPLPAPLPPREQIVAGVHVHPFTHGDSIPLNCKRGANRAYDARGTGGPSPDDWKMANSERGPAADSDFVTPWRKIPEYVIDEDSVYRADPGIKKSQWEHRPSWRRTTPTGCTRI